MSSVFFGIATKTFHYDRTLGRAEFSGAGFRQPMDLALGPEGIIYVVNRSWEYRPDGVRVTMLTINEEYIGEFSRFGDGDGQLHWPISIALDSDQNVYVSDDWLNRISVFDKDGVYLSKWGTSGSGDGELNKPRRHTNLTRKTTCTWWTAATTVSRSSPRTGSSWANGAAQAAVRASSTCPGA